MFNASTRIIANTKAGLEAYGAPPSKSGVIYNGFNFNRLKSIKPTEEVRAAFRITTPLVVGMVATFSPYKDYKTYVSAALEVVRKRKDVTFLCVGEGDDSAFRAMVPEEYKGQIRFLGKQIGVESIMNICNVGVLATDVKNHAEGISNALMEFMSLSKPVIATNFGGSKELIVNNETGYLVEAYDSHGLATKVDVLLTDTAKCMAMGAASRKRIEEHFSIDRMISAFYEEYQSLHESALVS